nr:hypothetical protein [Patescibacteria group bacterium]
VHLDLYPQPVSISDTEKTLLGKMANTRAIVSAALSIRVLEKVKIRQPLSSLYIKFLADSQKDFISELILDELNVKDIKVLDSEVSGDEVSLPTTKTDSFEIFLDTLVTEELKLEGMARDLVRVFQDLRKEQALNISDLIDATYENTEQNTKVMNAYRDEIMRKIQAQMLEPGATNSITKLP